MNTWKDYEYKKLTTKTPQSSSQALAYCKNYQSQLYQEQQYRQEFAAYCEAESQRMKQIFFYSNNIGKNCKEASSQLRKMK